MSPRWPQFLLFVLGLFAAVSPTLRAQTVKQVFDPYIGTWQGSFSVPMPNATTRVILARHDYEWDGNVLKGIHTFQEGNMLNYATSETFVDKNGRLFRKVSYQDQPSSTYYGEVKNGRVSWLPTAVVDASRFQTVEYFEPGRAGRVMRVIRTENRAEPGKLPQLTTYDGTFAPVPPKSPK